MDGCRRRLGQSQGRYRLEIDSGGGHSSLALPAAGTKKRLTCTQVSLSRSLSSPAIEKKNPVFFFKSRDDRICSFSAPITDEGTKNGELFPENLDTPEMPRTSDCFLILDVPRQTGCTRQRGSVAGC